MLGARRAAALFLLFALAAASALRGVRSAAAAPPPPPRAVGAPADAPAPRLAQVDKDTSPSAVPAGQEAAAEANTETIGVSLSQIVAFVGMGLLVREANKYARGE